MSIEETNSFEITFDVIQDYSFDVRSGIVMCEFIVVIEKRNDQLFRIVQMAHDNRFAKFRFTFFENIYILCYFSAVFVLVFMFEIDVSIAVDVV